MFNIFKSKKRHKHVWQEEKYINKKHHMYWRLRRCECGAVEILHAGGTGDKKWHPFTGKFRFSWEKKWFNAAKMVANL